MKKIISILISVLILGISLFILLFFNIPRITYSYDQDRGGYIVSNAYGNKKEYQIKSSYKGKKVVGIGERAFLKHSKLESIVFENAENITCIEKLAFSECPNLKSIDLSYVDEIERNAFSYDISLTEIQLSTTYIGASAFYHCDSLANVIIEEGLFSVGSMAFSECQSLKSLTLPSTTKEVFVDAFYNTTLTLTAPEVLKTNAYMQSLNNVIYY